MKKKETVGVEVSDTLSKKRLLRAVSLSERLLLRRLERALLCEDEIDALLALCAEYAAELGVSEKEKKELLLRVEALRCEDLSKLVGMIGLLLDKEAVLRGSEGGGGGGASSVCRFEDL